MSELTKEQLLEYVKKQKLKMKKLETEIVSLKERAENATAAAPTSSNDELSGIKLENESLEKQMQSRDSEIAALSKTIEELEDEKVRVVSEKNTEIARLMRLAEVSATEGDEKKELQSKVAQLESAVAHQQTLLAEYEQKGQQLDALQASIESYRSAESHSAAEMDRLKAELVGEQDRATGLEASVSVLNQQICEITASRDEVSAILIAGSSVENQLKVELDALRLTQSEMLKQQSAAVLESASLKAINSEVTVANGLLNQELAAAKDELLAKITALENAANQIKDLSAKLAESPKTVPTAPTEPSKVAENSTPDLAASTTAGKKKGKNNKKGKGKGQDAVDAPAAADEASDVADVPATSDGAGEAEAGVSDELQQKLRDQEEKYTQQVQQLEAQLAKALADAQAANAASTADLQVLSQQLNSVRTELADCAGQRSDLQAREAEMQAQSEALRTENQALTQQLNSASAASSTSLQDRDAELAKLVARTAELEAALLVAESSQTQAKQQHLDLTHELAGVQEKASSSAERASALELELQQVRDKVLQQSAALAAKQHDVDGLRDQVTSLQVSGNSSASERQAVTDRLTAQLSTMQAQLEASQAAEKALSEELAALKETSAQAESTTKKLMAKLKLKMKECTDLTADLTTAKESVSKSLGAEATSSALNEQLQAIQASLKKVSSDKAELEAKIKAQNDSLIAGEEKVAALLREKNKLQEDLFTTLHKVESSAKETQNFKAERDQARQQYLDVESKLQNLSASTRERIDSLSAKVTELGAANATLTLQNTTLNEALALSNSEITTLKESSSALAQANSKSKTLAATVETLKQQLEEAKTDADSKAEASNERIKKLKLLLTKVQAVSQEKDARLTQLQSLSDRAKKFNIVSRIGVVPPQDPTSEPLEWCLIYEHRAAPAKAAPSTGTSTTTSAAADGDSSQYRWIEARVAHKWMAEGSTLVGAWPQPVQETWSAEMNALRSRLESERDDMASKFEEISSQFQTYKVRAQTALKRIGNEDRNERQKAQEVESAEIERLRGVIQDLKEKEGDFSELLSEKARQITAKEQVIQELQTKVEQMEAIVADGETAHKANERKIASLQKEIEALHEDSKNMKEQYEAADRNNRERRMQQLRTEEEAALRQATMPLQQSAPTAAVGAIPSRHSSQNLTDDSQLDSSGADRMSSPPSSRPMSPKDAELNGSGNGVSPLRVVARTPSQNIPSISPRARSTAVEAALATDIQDGPATDSKLLLFQQADNILRDAIATLRAENSQLMVEINEIKNDVGLREDQVLALKNTIRELESSLCREKEFNAENRRINADYLVNILRNFLMSTEPSERAKLVPVLCQILHLRADESKVIAEKWAVRGGGLVGWLLPQRPAVVSTGTPRYQQHATGMSIDRGGEANGKGSGDLTYDPATGGGIDINSY